MFHKVADLGAAVRRVDRTGSGGVDWHEPKDEVPREEVGQVAHAPPPPLQQRRVRRGEEVEPRHHPPRQRVTTSLLSHSPASGSGARGENSALGLGAASRPPESGTQPRDGNRRAPATRVGAGGHEGRVPDHFKMRGVSSGKV